MLRGKNFPNSFSKEYHGIGQDIELNRYAVGFASEEISRSLVYESKTPIIENGFSDGTGSALK